MSKYANSFFRSFNRSASYFGIFANNNEAVLQFFINISYISYFSLDKQALQQQQVADYCSGRIINITALA